MRSATTNGVLYALITFRGESIEDKGKVTLGIKQLSTPRESDILRLGCDELFASTDKKTGISFIGMIIASPEIGKWRVRIKVTAQGNKKPSFVLDAIPTSKDFKFQKSNGNDTFLDDLENRHVFNKIQARVIE